MLRKKSQAEKTLDFDLLKKRFLLEIDYLTTYLNTLDSLKPKITSQLEDKAYNKTLENPEDESLIHDMYESEYKIINSYQYHSQLTLVYSIYESTLSDLCIQFQKETNTKLLLINIKGTGISETCLEYLRLVSSFKKESLSAFWPKLNNYRLIRNRIAHQNSIFSGITEEEIEIDKQKFIKLIELLQKDRFEITNRSFFIVNNQVNHDFIDIIKSVIEIIISHLENETFLIEQET
ncbi:MAG: hypothetical protein WC667_13270 [Sulfurimonas sp.]|jgi:hypothetical protein